MMDIAGFILGFSACLIFHVPTAKNVFASSQSRRVRSLMLPMETYGNRPRTCGAKSIRWLGHTDMPRSEQHVPSQSCSDHIIERSFAGDRCPIASFSGPKHTGQVHLSGFVILLFPLV